VKYLFILFAFLLPPLAACAEPTLSGIYETSHDSGTFAMLEKGEECLPPNRQEEYGCISPYVGKNILGLLHTPENDLNFSLSLDFFNGHSCSLQGIAKPDKDGWTYLEKNQAEENGAFCKLTFIMKDNTIVTHADGNLCVEYCGARGSLDKAEFPLSSKINAPVVNLQDLDCISSMESPCNFNTSIKENE